MTKRRSKQGKSVMEFPFVCLNTFSGLYCLHYIRNKCLTIEPRNSQQDVSHMHIKGKLPYWVSPSKILFLH
jgi:hypothetical protein